MGFHEYTGDADRNGRPGQQWHVAPMTTRTVAKPAGNLHRVRSIEDDRASRFAQNFKGPHVNDQIIVAKTRSSFADQDVSPAACAVRLVDNIDHLVRRQKLAFFNVDRLAAGGDRLDEIGLPAQERWSLQHIHNFSHDLNVAGAMHIGQHIDAELLFYFLENR